MEVFTSRHYRVTVEPTSSGTIHVQVQPAGPSKYMGPGPCFRICHPEPRWWKPWTWGRSVEGAVRDARRWIGRAEARRERAERAVHDAYGPEGVE